MGMYVSYGDLLADSCMVRGYHEHILLYISQHNFT